MAAATANCLCRMRASLNYILRLHMTITFWDRKLFDTNDALNRVIFEKSIELQKQIGIPSGCGAQQAMVGEDILRWIPDPLGKNWKSRDAILFCGSAYAGIFSPWSSRRGARTTTVEAYAAAQTLADLHGTFFDSIIDPPFAVRSDSYYGPIEALSVAVPDASYISLFDLCRASFVKRMEQDGTLRDKSGDAVVGSACELFSKYVETATPDDWLWKRISSGEARRIVAFGSIAEHGLLRLFQRHGQTVYLGSLGPLMFPHGWLKATNGRWVRDYAYESLRYKLKALELIKGRLQLDYWLKNSTWWSIRAPDGRERWRLLPVYHPTSTRLTGETLKQTISLLQTM
jgi:hypothetical protein